MVQTLLLSHHSATGFCGWYPGKLSLSTGAGIVRSLTKKNLMADPEQSPQNSRDPASSTENEAAVEDTPVASTSIVPPKFPSPSECSKWLMLFWFAGFPAAKIRLLLSKYFNLDGHKAYTTGNIESTFRRLQASADRSTGDYKTDPYMYIIITSKSSSPFEFRQNAVSYLEKHHPKLIEEMTGDAEILEMHCWHQRWMEEVRLMKKSKAPAYRMRASVFEEKLEHYTPHFDAKGFTAYLENKPSRRSKSAAPSPEPKSVHIRRSEELARQDEIRKITNIQRHVPLTTRMGRVFTRTKPEGTCIPSAAQHLDDLGFFAQRPAPSSTSIIGARTRTSSLQSEDVSV